MNPEQNELHVFRLEKLVWLEQGGPGGEGTEAGQRGNLQCSLGHGICSKSVKPFQQGNDVT